MMDKTGYLVIFWRWALDYYYMHITSMSAVLDHILQWMLSLAYAAILIPGF